MKIRIFPVLAILLCSSGAVGGQKADNPVESADENSQSSIRLIGSFAAPVGPIVPAGIECRVPPPSWMYRYIITSSDVFDEATAKEESRQYDDASSINRRIVSDLRYPFSDVCGLEGELDEVPRVDDGSLHSAVRLKDIDKVRDRSKSPFDVNSTDVWYRTPLHWAAELGYEDIMRVLLNRGADPNLADHRLATPLWLASYSGQLVAVQILLDYPVDITIKVIDDFYPTTPLQIAISRGHTEVVKTLFEEWWVEDEHLSEAIIEAIRSEHVDLLEWLLSEHLAELNMPPNGDSNPLIVAISETYDRTDEIVSILLKHGADPRACDEDGETVLELAKYYEIDMLDDLEEAAEAFAGRRDCPFPVE